MRRSATQDEAHKIGAHTLSAQAPIRHSIERTTMTSFSGGVFDVFNEIGWERRFPKGTRTVQGIPVTLSTTVAGFGYFLYTFRDPEIRRRLQIRGK
jgi:hypothetical protein